MYAGPEKRKQFAERVMIRSLDVGMRPKMAQKIISENNITFLERVVSVAEKMPDVELCQKVIDMGRSVPHAASFMGNWVYDITSNFNTFRNALKYYVDLEKEKENWKSMLNGDCSSIGRRYYG